jgi:2-oxoisovalerate dehydrogenase E1 component
MPVDSFAKGFINNRETCLELLEKMLITRALDEKMSKLVRQNKGGTFHLSVLGHEMLGTACAMALTPEKDWGFPYYRDRAFAVGIGCEIVDLIGAFLAREVEHHSGGRMMPEHFSHKRLRLPCQSSCVGSQFLQAVGCAKALKIAERDEIVYVSGGDGSTSQGDFHEALNFACIHKLNILFVIQDNGWAISVPVEEQTAGGTIAKIAAGYEGLSLFDVDGTDFLALSEALSAAVAKGRSDGGPSLIVAKIPRIGAHSSSDDPQKYKTKEHAENDKERDPLLRYEKELIELGMIDDLGLKAMKEEVFALVEEAAAQADQIPPPPTSSVLDHVFKEVDTSSIEEKEYPPSAEGIVIVDALNHALDEEMGKDEGVVVFGQDVAHGKGGVFGVTRHLTEKYSVRRCFNTPLAESTIIALAIGMSFVDGFKPVAEIQFADYLWTGINQLFNELSSIHYRSNGAWHCPVVVRMPCGGYIQGGPYHSQSIEGFLSHCPGLKIVIPSNSADAKRLLKMAIRDPNPVLFLEHKALYRQRVFCARKEPLDDELLPLGKAKVVRSGSDVTVIAYGMSVVMAASAAEALSSEGISVEVIDLRTIIPLDIETVSQSVRKTGKVLIVHEAARTSGFGAEIAAQIAESEFAYLDAPIRRVTGKDCPVSYNKELENATLPQPEEITAALRDLARY